METFVHKWRGLLLVFTGFLVIAVVYLMQESIWISTTESEQIEILAAEDQIEVVNIDGHNNSVVVGDSQVEDVDGWPIIYDEVKLRAEVDHIHDGNYIVKDGDDCTKSVPDCMIVGVGKCGTRELIDFMSIHPNIISKADGGYQMNSKLFESSSGHSMIKNKMPCKYHDQISVLKADTFLQAKSKPAEIFKLNPNMKIIAIIREPVSRLISHLSFHPKKKIKKNTIEKTETMKRYLQTMFKQDNTNVSFTPREVNLSTYDEGLERYLKTFKPDNVLVIESNEFKTDPTRVIRRVEQFLGIKKFVSNEHFALNPKKNFYCIRKTKSVPKSMVCYESNRGRKQTIEIDDVDMKALRNYFTPHNEHLFRLIGKRYDW